MNFSPALDNNAPGSRPVSSKIWKPLQIPITGVPPLAASATSRMIGEFAAIDALSTVNDLRLVQRAMAVGHSLVEGELIQLERGIQNAVKVEDLLEIASPVCRATFFFRR